MHTQKWFRYTFLCIYTLTIHTTHTSYIEMLVDLNVSNFQTSPWHFGVSALGFPNRWHPICPLIGQESPLDIYRCTSYCPGGVPGSCEAGRIGVTCGDCPQWEFVQSDAWRPNFGEKTNIWTPPPPKKNAWEFLELIKRGRGVNIFGGIFAEGVNSRFDLWLWGFRR